MKIQLIWSAYFSSSPAKLTKTKQWNINQILRK